MEWVQWLDWEALKLFANSNFGAALIAGGIGSLAGAWGGAWAAQRIADRARRPDTAAR